MIDEIHNRTKKALIAFTTTETTYTKYRRVCGYSVRKQVEQLAKEEMEEQECKK